MIVSYYTVIDKLWANEVFENKLQELPSTIRPHILKYADAHDRQLRICGKLLLLRILNDFYPEEPDLLAKLQYDQMGKPHLLQGFDFNIAHSGNIAICAATDNGSIGVDIEMVKDADLSLFEAYFTEREWKMINNNGNPLDQFYTMWVRKEAVIKAMGKGIYTPLLSVDVCDDKVSYEGNTFYLCDLQAQPGYKAAVATTQSAKVIQPPSLDLTTLSKLSDLTEPY